MIRSFCALSPLIIALGVFANGCRRGSGSSSSTFPGSTPASSQAPSADSAHTFAEPAANCQQCHPLQMREWQGSVMHYSAASPVFNAFELTVEKLSHGALAPNGTNPNFCVECHSPPAAKNEEVPDYTDDLSARPAGESFSEVSLQGVSCDVCHSAIGPDQGKSPLADGISNLSLVLAPGDVKQGTFADPAANTKHNGVENPFQRASEFCGGCHDVRLPAPDTVTGEPFQRLENLFTEWQQGPYNTTNNPYGRVVTCQDCHMSLYPQALPGTYPQASVALDDAGQPLPVRRHAVHAFTAVSLPMVEDPRFPRVDTTAVDSFGYPLGQQQRREQMLAAACELSLSATPGRYDPTASTIPIRVTVTNTGTGHNVPAGFSQERQVWVELIVEDDAGTLYESGVLHDQAHPETGEDEPDGRLDDEDLEDLHFTIDPDTFDTAVEDGPDADQRAAGVNLGLANFQNRFVRIHADGSWEPVLNPMLADHMDNSRSLPMLQPREIPYDVPVPARGIQGTIRVTARLRYRAFPPELLRFLAQREPELVDEALVDRNTIVDMAQSERSIRPPRRR